MARKMATQERNRKKEIEGQLSKLGTTAEKKKYLEEQKKLTQERIRSKIAKGNSKFEKMNAEMGVERKRKTSFKPGFDEKILKRIKMKIASLEEEEEEEEDGEQAAKRGTGGKQIKSGDSLSYRED